MTNVTKEDNRLYTVQQETFKGESFHELVENTIFVERTFTNSHKTLKSAKVFFLESLPIVRYQLLMPYRTLLIISL